MDSTGFESLQTVCGNSEDMEACIKENTRRLEDTIHVERGFHQNGVALNRMAELVGVPQKGEFETKLP